MATYQSPGVYIEEISAGPRPIQASGTTSTGFVGVLHLPSTFSRGFGTWQGATPSAAYADVLIPGSTGLFTSWTVARAFFPLAWTAFRAPVVAAQDKPALPSAATTVLQGTSAAETAGDAWGTMMARRRTLTGAKDGLAAATATQEDVDQATTEAAAASKGLVAARKALDTAVRALASLASNPPTLTGTGAAETTAAIPAANTLTSDLKAAIDAYETALGSKSTDATALATADLTAGAALEKTVVAKRAALDSTTAGDPAQLVTAMATAYADYQPVDPFASAAGNLGTITDLLVPGFAVQPPADTTAIVLQSSTAGATPLVLDRDPALVNLVKTNGTPTAWIPSMAANENPASLVAALGPLAIAADISYDVSSLPGVAGTVSQGLADKLGGIQSALANPAVMVTTMDGYHTWRQQLGRSLYLQILVQCFGATSLDAADRWRKLPEDAVAAWDLWIRSQTGMRLLEISLSGFFGNGGTTAYMGLALAAEDGDVAEAKSDLLKKWYDSVGDTAILVAPGLNLEWQSAILNYARMPAPSGRGDLFAILDTPRYLLTEPPSGTEVARNKNRWVTTYDGKDKSASAYEMPVLEFLASPVVPALRYNPNDTEMDACVPRDAAGFGAAYGPWLIARNPLASGTNDAFVVVPPSGFIAGCYAYNDNTFGVQKVPANQPVGAITDLVCSVTAVEQGPINVKGINLIRIRPGGMLIWGGRTTTTDALWRYINFRRVFLFIERSVRDAVQYAVFLPNNDQTRSDLSSTIAGFLYAQWQQGVLDGASNKDAYFVQCDTKNNPIETRRNGYLNVDVGMQPPYPAEFVVIRFRQMA